MEKSLNLTDEQIDALKEIGNIGGGNAATALSQLLNKKVFVDIPRIRIMRLDKLSDIKFLGDKEDLSTAISLRILGKLKGGMLIFYPQKCALLMIDILREREIGSTEVFTIEDESVLSESAHIISCSYLNAIGQFLGLYQLIPSISATSIDRVEKLTRVMFSKFIKEDLHYILPIENHLIIEDIELNLVVIFLLEFESLNMVLKTIGL
ncbi:MAG: chemotaxis protein CheC [Candidatus Omnitrophota bacterium]